MLYTYQQVLQLDWEWRGIYLEGTYSDKEGEREKERQTERKKERQKERKKEWKKERKKVLRQDSDKGGN